MGVEQMPEAEPAAPAAGGSHCVKAHACNQRPQLGWVLVKQQDTQGYRRKFITASCFSLRLKKQGRGG